MRNIEKAEKAIHDFLIAMDADNKIFEISQTAKTFVRLFNEFLSVESKSINMNGSIALMNGQMSLIKEIPFVSICETNMMPYSGIINIGFINENRFDITDFLNCVDLVTNDISYQNKVTKKITLKLMNTFKLNGVAIQIKAKYMANMMKGVYPEMISFNYAGCFKGNDQLKTEFKREIL